MAKVVLQHLNMRNIEWTGWRRKGHSPISKLCNDDLSLSVSRIYFSLRQYLWAESGEELPGALLRPPLPGSPPHLGRRETGLSWPPEPIVIKPFHPKEGA